MIPVKQNMFRNIPQQLPNEKFETILNSNGIKIERIVSRGHTTPETQWYDQAWDEWVLLVQGSAKLIFAETGQSIKLDTGDYLLIPAHEKHRITWTTSNPETIWLTVRITKRC